MCVILALETQKELDSLTLEILKSAESMNPDGNGYATLINGKVVFEKAITIEDIWTKIKNKEIIAPCVIHCRITSVGKTLPELCHPFVVNESSNNALSGTISDDESVLFHNGTFSEYKDLVLQTAMGAGRHLPSGAMSDTRGIAFVLQTLGIEALEYIDTGFNKFAVLNSKGLQKFGSWVDVNGISSSNNYYDRTKAFTYGNFPQNDYFQYDEFNDEDTILYNSEQRAKQLEIENDNEPLYNMDKAQKGINEFTKTESKCLEICEKYGLDVTGAKVSKKEHKANKKFLKEHGWKSFAQFSKQELREIVNAMQTQNKLVKKIDKTKKEIFENSLTMEDYEDVIAYQKYNPKSYHKDLS